jgi:endonuclease/exonuclease/phosphatase (EEP) superfamily protein YafD
MPRWPRRANRQETNMRPRVALALVPLGFVALAGPTSLWWWPGELCCHWTLHAAVGLALGAIVWRRQPAIRRVCLALVAVALVPWVRAGLRPHALVPNPPSLSVAWANLDVHNETRSETLAAVAATDADLIGITEVLPPDRAFFEHEGRWPYQAWTDAGGTTACGLLSRRPIVARRAYVWEGRKALEVTLEVGGNSLRVMALHLDAPVSPVKWRHRDQEVRDLTESIAGSDLPLLVMGDFNATPATHAWRALVDATGLLPGPGGQPPTWPAWSFPFAAWCPGISIDHVLVRRGTLGPAATFRLPGSDHLGVRTTWAPAE